MDNVNSNVAALSKLEEIVQLALDNLNVPNANCTNKLGIYIFSTGQGGQATCRYLLTNYVSNNHKYYIRGFLDNNPRKRVSTVTGFTVFSPHNAIIDGDDIIIIASLNYCYDMKKQLLERGIKAEQIILPGNWLTRILAINKQLPSLKYPVNKLDSEKIYETYIMNLIRSASEKSKDFIDDDPYLKVDLTEQDVKLIAFYLPQFHSIPENDSWWEKGFTEWTNVTKTVPQYNGHYQPHFPTDLGFYDLRNIGIMKRQVEMAKQYGIYGFCFYHYWFAGQRLLETPVNNFLKHKELVYPFCLCWANENWTRRWDGLENEILISQNHSEEDDLAFIEDAARYFKSKRYIKIQGRPLFIVYRPLLFPDPEKTIKIWKEYCRQMDIGDLFVAGIKGFGLEQNDIYGLDALIEFPPFGFYSQDITDSVMLMNSNFSGAIYDYNFCINKDYLHKEKGLIFRGVMPGWDNTARRPDAATIFHDSCPEKYQNWLENAIRFTKDKLPNEQQFIFVNAWNEWAEGAHLEPDRKYGYGNLHATAKALIKSRTRE